MEQKARESKKSNDNRPVQVITSPEGVKIQITAGNKWKFTRAVHRAGKKQYSELQKQIMTILIDLTNEGYGPDLSKWGWAYPSFVKLAAECGCTPEAAKSNIKKLEAKGVLTVKRSAGKRASGKKGEGGGGGCDKTNLYWLHGWNEFGRVENGETETVIGVDRLGTVIEGTVIEGTVIEGTVIEGTVIGNEGTVIGKEGTVIGVDPNGNRRLPDSSSYPPSYTASYPPHIAPASGERGPADLDLDDRTSLPKWARHPEGLLAGDWWWDDREFQPAIDLLGLDEDQMDDEIDRFIAHHRDERRHDWNPGWLEWIQALKGRQSGDGLLEQSEEEAPF